MSEKRYSAHAVATLTVEVYGLGSWGQDCAMSQIVKQASEEAVGHINRMNKDRRIRIVGEPVIKSIVTLEEK